MTTINCAYKLRRDILNLENKVLEEPLRVEDILKSDVEIPDPVKKITKHYTQEKMKHKNLYLQEKSDLLSHVLQKPYIQVPGGCGIQVPGKRLSLGFAVKPLAGRKNVVTLMNNYEHCASSETIRRIDMSFETTINDKNSVF